MDRRSRSLFRAVVTLCAAAGMLVFASLALANAPNPLPGTGKVDKVVVNADGSTTVTVEGQWNWVTQTDCPTARNGVGYQVAWFDPSDTANPIGQNNSPNGVIDVGGPIRPGGPNDNIVHAVQTEPGGGNATFGLDVPSSYVGGNPTQADAQNWVSNCNNEDPSTKVSSGAWGPITHTYPASFKGPFIFCPVMYDPHGGGTTSGGKIGSSGQGDLTAGGNGHNNDNSYEGNGTGANGNNCQQFTIAKIVTSATTPVTLGGSIQDTATVTGSNPTGTVTFKLYNNASCTAPAVFTDTETLSNGSATSKSFTPTSAGSYYWIASYSGDANNGAVSGNCGDTGEVSTVNPNTPGIVTSATASAIVGGSIQDTATVTGSNPTGTVTFNLYDNASCTAPAVFTDTETLTSGAATSKSYSPPSAGSYYWIASYSGDTNNKPVSGKCGDNGEISTVSSPGIRVVKLASAPCADLAASATQPSGILPCNGQFSSFTSDIITVSVPHSGSYAIPIDYQIRVTNTGSTPLTLKLDDPLCDQGTEVGPTLVPGTGTLSGKTLSAGGSATYTCTHTLTENDPNTTSSGEPFTNTATVTGQPTSGPPVHGTSIVTVDRQPGPPPQPQPRFCKSVKTGKRVPWPKGTPRPKACRKPKPPPKPHPKPPKHPHGFTG